MKLLITLLLAISTVTSWGCHSHSCRTVRQRCYQPSCGVRSYLTNRDYFMYWWKPAVRVLRLAPSNWRKELAAAKAENAEEMAAMQNEVDEVRADNEALAAETRAELASVQSQLDEARAELESVRSEANEAVAAARQELVDYQASQALESNKWAELNSKLRTDVDNLRTVLENHRRDDLRSVVLWPTSCGNRCATNYNYVYGVWTNLATRLDRVFPVEWAGLPCGRRLRSMRTRFLSWCQPYPEPVRTRLVGYYDYLVAGKACTW